jgi:hypothetical protein
LHNATKGGARGRGPGGGRGEQEQFGAPGARRRRRPAGPCLPASQPRPVGWFGGGGPRSHQGDGPKGGCPAPRCGREEHRPCASIMNGWRVGGQRRGGQPRGAHGGVGGAPARRAPPGGAARRAGPGREGGVAGEGNTANQRCRFGVVVAHIKAIEILGAASVHGVNRATRGVGAARQRRWACRRGGGWGPPPRGRRRAAHAGGCRGDGVVGLWWGGKERTRTRLSREGCEVAGEGCLAWGCARRARRCAARGGKAPPAGAARRRRPRQEVGEVGWGVAQGAHGRVGGGVAQKSACGRGRQRRGAGVPRTAGHGNAEKRKRGGSAGDVGAGAPQAMWGRRVLQPRRGAPAARAAGSARRVRGPGLGFANKFKEARGGCARCSRGRGARAPSGRPAAWGGSREGKGENGGGGGAGGRGRGTLTFAGGGGAP